MTLLLEADPATAETLALAIGRDTVTVESGHALVRALDDSPEEILVVIGADVDLDCRA